MGVRAADARVAARRPGRALPRPRVHVASKREATVQDLLPLASDWLQCSEMLDGRIVFHSPSELPEDTRNRRKKLLTSKPSDPWQAAGRWMAGRASAGRLDTEKKYLFKERGLGRGIPRLSQIGRPADDGKRLDSLSPAMDVAS